MMKNILDKALSMGFHAAVASDPTRLLPRKDIRAQCNPRECEHYNTCWICPPGCGELDEIRQQLRGYKYGFVVQSYYTGAAAADPSRYQSLCNEHNQRIKALVDELRPNFPKVYALSTGGCVLCESCTYPDAPCRHPEERIGSLSAYGINVSDLCERADLEYDFVPGMLYLIGYILLD